MPEISRFYGIIIKMYFGDHNPPHFATTWPRLGSVLKASS